MNLKFLKDQMLLPKEEYILNKSATVQDTDILVLSYTVEEDKNCLWLLYRNQEKYPDDIIPCEYQEKSRTYREELLSHIDKYNKTNYIHIREVEIQGQVVKFDSSSCSALYENNIEGFMRLQHFVEKGLISEAWDDVRIENLVIARYEQSEGDMAPIIDITKDLSISIKIERTTEEIPIQFPFKIKFGKQDIGKKFTYYDEQLGKEIYFFIDEIYSYNVYENIKKKVEEIEDVKVKEAMLNNFKEALVNICPRDKNLAVILYEAEDNMQLRFLMKDHLNETIKRRNSATSIGFIGSPDKNTGMNGYKLRECVLQPLDKDFSGELEIELFSRYLEVPEETIKLIDR